MTLLHSKTNMVADCWKNTSSVPNFLCCFCSATFCFSTETIDASCTSCHLNSSSHDSGVATCKCSGKHAPPNGAYQPDRSKLQHGDYDMHNNSSTTSTPASDHHSTSSCSSLGQCSCSSAFTLQPTGRYAHSVKYLHGVSSVSGWRMHRLCQGVIRHNAGKAIHGNLCVWRLADSSG